MSNLPRKIYAQTQSVYAFVDTMLERLGAELFVGSLDMLFSIFDLPCWFAAFRSAQDGDASKLQRLRRHPKKFA